MHGCMCARMHIRECGWAKTGNGSGPALYECEEGEREKRRGVSWRVVVVCDPMTVEYNARPWFVNFRLTSLIVFTIYRLQQYLCICPVKCIIDIFQVGCRRNNRRDGCLYSSFNVLNWKISAMMYLLMQKCHLQIMCAIIIPIYVHNTLYYFISYLVIWSYIISEQYKIIVPL